MYKRITWLCCLLFTGYVATAQQIAHAKDVMLVSTPGTKIVTQGGIKFSGTTLWKDSGTTTLQRNPAGFADWVDSTAAGVLFNNIDTIIFNNTANTQQLIGKTTFYNLTVNGKGINLNQSNEVKNLLSLDDGLVYFQTTSDSIYVSNPAIVAISSASSYATSWVHGKLSRKTNVIGGGIQEYLFPIGKFKNPDSLYAPVKFDKFNSNNATYTAEYFPFQPANNSIIENPPLDHVSELEYWEIIGSNYALSADDDAKLTLSWRTYSIVSPSAITRDSLIVAHYFDPGAGNRWMSEHIIGGTANTGNVSGTVNFGYVKSNKIIGNFTDKYFTLGTMSKWNALPVKLLYWTAIADGNKVRLNWNVEEEKDVVKYDIEKSVDGIHFTHLLSVASLQKNAWLYTAFDYSPVTGWNYYRLKITDRANKFEYAGIRKVRFDKGLQFVRIFPNPATDKLNILLPSGYNGKVSLQLHGIDGRFISTMKPASVYVQLNVSHLPAGSYVLKLVKQDGTAETYHFIKQ